jgi:hypothetical protein
MGKRFRDTGLKVPEENKKPSWRQQGQRVIEIGRINIDYSCFKKTPEEKLKLKLAKLSAK